MARLKTDGLEQPRLPNCIVNGVAKSGTSSVFHYLKSHSDVFMSARKELNFFSNSAYFNTDGEVLDDSLDEYTGNFAGSDEFKIIGEASPKYFDSQVAAKNIFNIVPDVKLITTLRNPVDRAYSGYLMQVRKGRTNQPIAEAFEPDEHWVQMGFYWENLKRYFDLFDRGSIKIVLLEDLTKDKSLVMTDLLDFLDLDTANYNYHDVKKHNVGYYPKSIAVNRLLNDRSPLKTYLKKIAPNVVKSAKNRINRFNSQSLPEMPEETRANLRKHYLSDILRTEELIERDLSAWYQ